MSPERALAASNDGHGIPPAAAVDTVLLLGALKLKRVDCLDSHSLQIPRHECSDASSRSIGSPFGEAHVERTLGRDRPVLSGR